MAEISRKDELEKLEKIIAEAQEKLEALRAENREEQNSHLIGKHFKYRDSHAYPKELSDFWWHYFKVTAVKGVGVFGFSFQQFQDGKIEVDPIKRLGANELSLYEEIPEEEFLYAWGQLVLEINYHVIEKNIYTIEEDISGDERRIVERSLDVYSGAG